MRIVHAYTGVSPNSLEVAQALQERGWLECDFTTLAYLPNHPFDASLMALAAAIGWNRIQSELFRRCHDLPSGGRVLRYPWWEVARVAADRMQLGAVAKDKLWERGSAGYDRWVARKLYPGINAVIGYEHSCLHTFRRAHELGIRTIYNMNAPHPAVAEQLINESMPPELATETPDARYFKRLFRSRLAHKDREFASADYVIANSQFTAESLRSRGFPTERIDIVPLGAPEATPFLRPTLAGDKMVFLYAGRVAVHKGGHLLLKAWDLARPHNCELWFAGGWDLPVPPASMRTPGVRVLGNLTREELYACYRKADLLLFPTLCDGFGMVVTEALAHGLPVLTTFAAGAADLIREGENGLVIPPGDVTALRNAITECARTPDRIRAMRIGAKAAATARPWSIFRQEYADALLRLLT
jgi:glycosyltransferase involved in cell wall biosynthesis